MVRINLQFFGGRGASSTSGSSKRTLTMNNVDTTLPELIPNMSTKQLTTMPKTKLKSLALQALIRTTMEIANKWGVDKIDVTEARRRVVALGGVDKMSTQKLIQTIKKGMKKSKN